MLRKASLRTSQQFCIVILSFHLILSLPTDFFRSGFFFQPNPVMHPLLYSSYLVDTSNHLCDHFGSVWRGVHIVKLFIKEFFSVTYASLRSRCCQHLVLKPCSCLRVRDHVSHPHKTTGKIVVVRMLSVKFFHLRKQA